LIETKNEEIPVEKVLIKLADQLAAFDEASLTSLWDKYEDLAREFHPTKKWEQAVMILGLIQVLRWKNHLFNCHWAAHQQPTKNVDAPALPLKISGKRIEKSKSAKVLPFRTIKSE
jgi:hypothetical protein